MFCKKIFFLVLLQSGLVFGGNLEVSVKASEHEKINIKLIWVGKERKKTKELVDIVKRDLEFSGQFNLIVQNKVRGIGKKSDIKSLSASDCSIGIFLTEEKKNRVMGWRLYDLEYACMLHGAACKAKGKDIYGLAHSISDSIWPHLTNEPGFFSTKIAYCKEIKRPGKKSYKHVYIADYDGSNEQLIVSTPTVNVAPRWNYDPENPLIFYSEHTNENVRLMFVDMKKRRAVVSNFDGLNILSAFSLNGKQFAYCASRGDGYCQIYYYENKNLKRITNKGNNISPTFANNGKTLYFCSDAHTGRPQICRYDLVTDRMERVSKGGFAVSTTFSEKKGLLAYAKMVNRVMQIFVYDPKIGSHRQITHSAGNKEECSWSPCGNYLLFAVEHGAKSSLAIFNFLTNEQRDITSGGSNCYYPSWSPFYNDFPSIS